MHLLFSCGKPSREPIGPRMHLCCFPYNILNNMSIASEGFLGIVACVQLILQGAVCRCTVLWNFLLGNRKACFPPVLVQLYYKENNHR